MYFTDKKFLERSPVVASVALGLVHAWVGRYSMNPDGISYLDMGEALVRRDWQSAINAYWSPLFHLAKVTEKKPARKPPSIDQSFRATILAGLALRPKRVPSP